MKYLLLNLLFTVVALGAVFYTYYKKTTFRRLTLVFALLLILTAIFDSLIVYSGIVDYNQLSILGIYIGKAPLEDFFYALVAAILGPVLWDYYESK